MWRVPDSIPPGGGGSGSHCPLPHGALLLCTRSLILIMEEEDPTVREDPVAFERRCMWNPRELFRSAKFPLSLAEFKG